jgi:hypothetical protein
MSSIARTSGGGSRDGDVRGPGGLIIKRTRALPLAPGMKPTGRHTQEPQDRSQWEILAGPIHGAQDPRLGASVR